MRSEATTVEAYLDELPDDRRRIVSAVRDMVNASLPDGYVEGMNWGMISWEIPLERYPDTYNGQPLGAVALASQKQHCSLYLHGPYMDPALTRRIEDGFRDAGKKLNMGKSCIRFRSLDQLPEEVIREVVGALNPDQFIALYEAARSGSGRKK
jgi:hypothetical protein